MRALLALVALTTVFAVVGAKLLPSKSPERRADSSAEAGPSAPGGPPGQAPETEEARLTNADPEDCPCPEKDKGGQDYIIATLPDPIDSSSGYRFDTLVDTIQRAVETQGYVLDRYYYPWRAGAKAPRAKAATNRTTVEGLLGKEWLNVTVRLPGPYQLPRHQREPGFLLFRGTEGCTGPKHLVVFLVSETATRGIHQEAFLTALRCIVKHKGCGPERPVRVLGPFFSGSHHSLIRAVVRWKGEIYSVPDFTIISGSATQINGEEFEARLCNEACANAKFRTTVHPEKVLKREALTFLRLKEEQLKHVAVLVETNTEMGGSMAPQEPHGIHLPFPLYISDIRAAYERNRAAPGAPLPEVPSSLAKLHLPASGGREPTDTEPSLTPAATAVMSEQVLANILTTISRERIKYVVIHATDIKDKIFLTTLIRSKCPDVQLLLFGNALIFSHPDYSYYFKGAIVASTYPLYSKNQRWSYPFRGGQRRLLLPDQETQGVYNASIALMAESAPCRRKDVLKELLEYEVPFENVAGCRRPPVWICMVGQDGPYPLHCAAPRACDYQKTEEYRTAYQEYEKHVYADKSPADKEPREGPRYDVQYTGFWVGPCIGVVLFCGLAACWCYSTFVKAQTTKANTNGWRSSFKTLYADDPSLWEPRQYFMLCLTALAVVCCYLALVTVLAIRFTYKELPSSGFPYFLLPGITSLLTVALVILIVVLAIFNAIHTGGRFRQTLLSNSLVYRLHRIVWNWRPTPGTPRSVCQVAADMPHWVGILAGISVVWLIAPVLIIGAVVLLGDLQWLHNYRLHNYPVPRYLLGAILLFFGLVLTNPAIHTARWWQWVLAVLLLPLPVIFLTRSWPDRPPALQGKLDDLVTKTGAFLFVERASNLPGGVTPVLPVFFLMMAIFTLAYFQLKRPRLRSETKVASPFLASTAGPGKKIQEQDTKLNSFLDLPSPETPSQSWSLVIGLAILLFIFCRVYSGYVTSVEGLLHDCVIFLAFAFFALLLGYALWQSYFLWDILHDLLGEVARLPLGRAFGRLPDSVTRTFGPYLSSRNPRRDPQLAPQKRQLLALAIGYGKVRGTLTGRVGERARGLSDP